MADLFGFYGFCKKIHNNAIVWKDERKYDFD